MRLNIDMLINYLYENIDNIEYNTNNKKSKFSYRKYKAVNVIDITYNNIAAFSYIERYIITYDIDSDIISINGISINSRFYYENTRYTILNNVKLKDLRTEEDFFMQSLNYDFKDLTVQNIKKFDECISKLMENSSK